MADERIVNAVKIADPTTTSQVAGVNAGGNLQVILASNSGVDIGDVDILSVIPGVGATNLGKAEDAVHSDGDTGVMSLAVRNDTLAALAGTDGDYAPIQVSALGSVYSILAEETLVDDAAFTPGTSRVFPFGATFDDTTPDSVDEDDIGALRMSANRNLYMNIRDAAGNERGANVDASNNLNVILASNSGVDIGDVDILSVIPGVGATNLGKAEDAAHADGDTGVMFLGVRNDSNGTTFSGTDGDYTPIAVDAQGNLQVDVLSGAGADTPTTPVVVEANTTDTAAGSTSGTTLQTSDLGSGTHRLSGFDCSSSVPIKVVLQQVDNDVATDLVTLFDRSGAGIQWRPPHREYFNVTFGGTAGFDGWRLLATNLDTSEAADLYGTIYYQDN
jgi:hypothetical protein